MRSRRVTVPFTVYLRSPSAVTRSRFWLLPLPFARLVRSAVTVLPATFTVPTTPFVTVLTAATTATLDSFFTFTFYRSTVLRYVLRTAFTTRRWLHGCCCTVHTTVRWLVLHVCVPFLPYVCWFYRLRYTHTYRLRLRLRLVVTIARLRYCVVRLFDFAVTHCVLRLHARFTHTAPRLRSRYTISACGCPVLPPRGSTGWLPRLVTRLLYISHVAFYRRLLLRSTCYLTVWFCTRSTWFTVPVAFTVTVPPVRLHFGYGYATHRLRFVAVYRWFVPRTTCVWFTVYMPVTLRVLRLITYLTCHTRLRLFYGCCTVLQFTRYTTVTGSRLVRFSSARCARTTTHCAFTLRFTHVMLLAVYGFAVTLHAACGYYWLVVRLRLPHLPRLDFTTACRFAGWILLTVHCVLHAFYTHGCVTVTVYTAPHTVDFAFAVQFTLRSYVRCVWFHVTTPVTYGLVTRFAHAFWFCVVTALRSVWFSVAVSRLPHCGCHVGLRRSFGTFRVRWLPPALRLLHLRLGSTRHYYGLRIRLGYCYRYHRAAVCRSVGYLPSFYRSSAQFYHSSTTTDCYTLHIYCLPFAVLLRIRYTVRLLAGWVCWLPFCRLRLVVLRLQFTHTGSGLWFWLFYTPPAVLVWFTTPFAARVYLRYWFVCYHRTHTHTCRATCVHCRTCRGFCNTHLLPVHCAVDILPPARAWFYARLRFTVCVFGSGSRIFFLRIRFRFWLLVTLDFAVPRTTTVAV